MLIPSKRFAVKKPIEITATLKIEESNFLVIIIYFIVSKIMTLFETKNRIIQIYKHLIVNKEVEEYILVLRKNFKWLMALSLVSIISYFSIYYTNYHYYRSECTILVNQDVMNIGATNYSFLNDDQLPTSTAENRLMFIFNSNALRDSLLYRLDLINHYNIRKTTAFRYEKTVKKLSKLVKLQRIDNNIYKIFVNDKENTAIKYQTLIDTLDKQNHQIQKIQFDLVQKVTTQDLHSLEIQKYVSNAINSLKSLNEGNIHQIEAYKFILMNEKQMDLNAVTVLTKAYPDVNLGYDFINAFIVCVYFIIGIFTFFMVGFVFYHTNKIYIHLLLFGKNKP